MRIGLSGWSYASWRGGFYPKDLPRGRELEYAAERFPSLEANAPFYSLQRPSTYARWREATPPGFVMAVKGSRFLTHAKRLADVEGPLANFLASGVLALGEKLGPFLWQLPPDAKLDQDRLDAFLRLLPRDADAAARLARGHDARVKEPFVDVIARRRLRHALEVRSPETLVPAVARLARRHGVALVVSDAGKWSCVEDVTAGFVYVRLHGSPKTYVSRYGDAALARWAARIRAWRDGGEPDDACRLADVRPPARRSRDVYVYFDNDAKGHAPRDALRLMALLDA